jgi:hypothetical protein
MSEHFFQYWYAFPVVVHCSKIGFVSVVEKLIAKKDFLYSSV